ncbi:MAG: DUF542 domain-containing protein [Clostridia bacterium]
MNIESKLGEIVTALFKVSGIFDSYNLDYCCNGHNSIEESCKKANLYYSNIISKLSQNVLRTHGLIMENYLKFINLEKLEKDILNHIHLENNILHKIIY